MLLLLSRSAPLLTLAAVLRQPPTGSALRPAVRGLVASAPRGLPEHLETMVEELASGEAQLFDVREPQEAMMGKLKDSILVPLSELQGGLPPPIMQGAAPDKLTYVHCAAGIRVHPAASILQALGYERVVPLQEGFATLANMGFELEG